MARGLVGNSRWLSLKPLPKKLTLQITLSKESQLKGKVVQGSCNCYDSCKEKPNTPGTQGVGKQIVNIHTHPSLSHFVDILSKPYTMFCGMYGVSFNACVKTFEERSLLCQHYVYSFKCFIKLVSRKHQDSAIRF